jgi:uncharacterized protein YxeA
MLTIVARRRRDVFDYLCTFAYNGNIMRINTKKSHKKTGLVIAIIIVAVLIIAGGYWFFTKKNTETDNAKENSSSQNSDKTDSSSSTDNNSQDNSSTDNNSTLKPDKDTTVNNTIPQTNGKLTVSVLAPNGQPTISGGTLSINTLVEQVVNGTCTLTIGSYTSSAPLVAGPQSSSCNGFIDIPANNLSGNTFTITAVSSDGKLSGSVTGTIVGE